MRYFAVIAVLLLATTRLAAADLVLTDHARKAMDIYRIIIEIDTSKAMDNTPVVARYLADELLGAGFSQEDIEIVSVDNFAGMVVRYRGHDSSGLKPILLLGHLDVVEAQAKDWERPPFELTQDEVNFYARGTRDNKFGVAQLTATFIRLKRAGFVPSRDLFLVFSGDEESDMLTSRKLAFETPALREAEFALNSDSGSGVLKGGKAINYRIQAAEKTYVTWELTVTNPGGHSSRPQLDNAIYELAAAVTAIGDYRFPVRWSEMTLAYLQATGKEIGGELGDAMQRFAYDPNDKEAADRLFGESSYVGVTRTTCVVTMLQAGHAENALPQTATATVNCRVFPGVTVAQVKQQLTQVIGNDAVTFKQIGAFPESPESDLRLDVLAAVGKAVHSRYPGIPIIGYMAASATDAMYFRNVGIPTLGVAGVFMDPAENYSHGLNERVPKKAFFDALDHWTIILQELAGPSP